MTALKMRYTFGRFTTGVLLVLFVAAGCGGERNTEGTDENIGDTVAADTMGSAADQAAMSSTVQKINVNTASADEFKTIPNVGDRMVGEFEEYRPYVSIQQFRREIGKYVDDAQIATYEEYLYVPIDPNESDRETLMQVPGLDETEAGSLIDARPFGSEAAFLEALSEYVSQEELRTGESYLAGM